MICKFIGEINGAVIENSALHRRRRGERGVPAPVERGENASLLWKSQHPRKAALLPPVLFPGPRHLPSSQRHRTARLEPGRNPPGTRSSVAGGSFASPRRHSSREYQEYPLTSRHYTAVLALGYIGLGSGAPFPAEGFGISQSSGPRSILPSHSAHTPPVKNAVYFHPPSHGWEDLGNNLACISRGIFLYINTIYKNKDSIEISSSFNVHDINRFPDI